MPARRTLGLGGDNRKTKRCGILLRLLCAGGLWVASSGLWVCWPGRGSCCGINRHRSWSRAYCWVRACRGRVLGLRRRQDGSCTGKRRSIDGWNRAGQGRGRIHFKRIWKSPQFTILDVYIHLQVYNVHLGVLYTANWSVRLSCNNTVVYIA